MPRQYWLFLGLFLCLRLIFWWVTFPNPDEAYYWLWGQHPALSYYDHPALQAWAEGLVTALFGRSSLVLRLPNLVSNGLFFYTYYQICRYLYGRQARPYFWMVVLLVLASPLYFLFLALAWPDHLLITLSLLGSYLMIRFLDGYLVNGRGNSWRLYGAALALGLAGLAKYNAAFVWLGLLAAIASHSKLRPLFRDYRLYLAGMIGLCCLLPIGLWNFSNNFQSWQYYANRSVDSGGGLYLKPWEPIGFLLISALTLSPLIGVMIYRLLRHPRIVPNSIYPRVAIWLFAVSTLSLTAIALISTALYYWNITAYLLLFPLLPKYLSSHRPTLAETASVPFTSRLFFSSQIYGLIFATLLVCHYSFVPISALFGPEGDPDSRMLFGWQQVAAAVETEAATLGNQPFLATSDYRSASALAYQLQNPAVMAISDRLDQFDIWYPSDRLFIGRNAILLWDDWHPLKPEILQQFEATSKPNTVTVTRFGVLIKKYYLARGYNFQGGRVSQATPSRLTLPTPDAIALPVEGNKSTGTGYPRPGWYSGR